ncbi:pleckstrin homology domain-containing family J member 1 [Anabrus simplex]|uniref:pleckstrin homology domain-containing family J member 1 n=1 Tax=Anabrus simplex TaxID=316456 RepID=UPI0035A3D370
MRFNDKELAEIGIGPVDLEGRLNHRRPTSGNFSQSGFKERWFKLKANLLFYFRINEVGKIDYKQPAGVFVLENSNIQYEMGTGIPFAFSVTFRDEPDRKHMFSGRSESHIQQWVVAMKQATYEYWRSQLILLQTKLNSMTGKDPLLLYPHNEGTVRDIQPSYRQQEKSVGRNSSTFQSHVQGNVNLNKVVEISSTSSFQSHIQLGKPEESLSRQSEQVNFIEL